ncbi:Hcp family type VI secretion system effector [Haloarchaeobius sp. TZWWS8]|uniref:Hcp family type VI secretion system effector n=1 Tax=Haloarchaeobius sp. TZWWS8 TaxID=3446121 RepID=UPI003EBD4498
MQEAAGTVGIVGLGPFAPDSVSAAQTQVGEAGACPASTGSVFLEVNGIAGESVDHDYRDEIDVLSWSWGMATGDEGVSRRGANRRTHRPLTIVKRVDGDTPKLLEALAFGGRIAETTLTVHDQRGRTITVVLRDVKVNPVDLSHDSCTQWPVEVITFGYRSIGVQVGTAEVTIDRESGTRRATIPGRPARPRKRSSASESRRSGSKRRAPTPNRHCDRAVN